MSNYKQTIAELAAQIEEDHKLLVGVTDLREIKKRVDEIHRAKIYLAQMVEDVAEAEAAGLAKAHGGGKALPGPLPTGKANRPTPPPLAR